MKALKAVLRAIDWFNERLGDWLSYLLLIIFVLLLMEVIRRYFFNSPTVWANELSQMLFGAYVILSGGHILRRGGHVNVDIVYTTLRARVRAGLDVFTSVLFFIFCGVLLYYASSLAWESLVTLEHSQSAWNPPLYPVKLTLPLGALLLLLQGVSKLVKDVCILLDIDLGDVAPPSAPAPGEARAGESL